MPSKFARSWQHFSMNGNLLLFLEDLIDIKTIKTEIFLISFFYSFSIFIKTVE